MICFEERIQELEIWLRKRKIDFNAKKVFAIHAFHLFSCQSFLDLLGDIYRCN